MSEILDSSTWEPTIYQISKDDLVLGGAPIIEDNLIISGVANIASQQLTNRTNYLKDRADVTDGNVADLTTQMATANTNIATAAHRLDVLEPIVATITANVVLATDDARTSAQLAGVSASDAAVSAASAADAATSCATALPNASAAANSATAAATSATTSATNAAAAGVSATAAAASKNAASISETNSATSASNSSTSATAASASKTAAANSASAAATSASAAASSASDSATAAANSATSATNASNSSTSASTSATNAGVSATSATASKTAAAASATAATASQTAASASQTAAAASAAAALSSANNAGVSETNSATSATNAATSALAAANSASSASTNATNAVAAAAGASTNAASVATNASAAATSATNAANSAAAASTSQTAAATSATAAAASQTAASTSQTAAAGSVTSAATSATNAASSATAAATSATNASNSSVAATTSQNAAATSATNAAASATTATGAQAAVASSATAAATSATAASTSATNAGNSATAASTSATNAANSATAAAASQSAAATSATNSATSETNAGNSATAAATSATNASAAQAAVASSATAAATSATNATASQSAAATSATNAATSETNAGNSATAASGSASAAANSATASGTSATASANSANSAASSATDAANSAAAALAYSIQHYRGYYTTLAALTSGVSSPIGGDYADVDAGTGSNASQYIWDTNDNVWVPASAPTPVTASQVKALYESNLNTNAYTDVEKAKLGTMSSIGYPSLAVAATINIGSTDSETINITNVAGPLSITSFGTANAGVYRRLIIAGGAGAKTLVYNATSMIIPGSANLVFSAGMVIETVSLGGGNWKVTSVCKADGTAVVSSPWTGGTATGVINESSVQNIGVVSSKIDLGAAITNTLILNASDGSASVSNLGTGVSGSKRKLINLYSGSVAFDTTGNINTNAIGAVTSFNFNYGDVLEFTYNTLNSMWFVTDYVTTYPQYSGIGVGGVTGNSQGIIDIAGSSTNPRSAPIKLRAGTNMTTPENGAFEYDGTSLTFTTGSSRLTLASPTTNLGTKAANGANSDITSLTGLTTALSVAQGGTGLTVAQTTNNIGEGTTNLYYKDSRAIAAVLTGFAVGSNATVAATDSILAAIGKVQAQINANVTSIGTKAAKGANSDITSLTGLTTALSVAQGGTGLTVAQTSDNIAEGSTNLYYKDSRAIAALLTGFTVGANSTVSATDSILVAIEKVQGQINANVTSIGTKAAKGANSDITSLTGLTTALSVAQGGTGVTTLPALATAMSLDQVTNTSDANKPVSTAQQTALNAKLALAGGTMSGAFNEAPFVTLASASTVAVGAAAANTVNITGTTTITGFDTIAAGARRTVGFAGSLTLTHNATSFSLIGLANIVTQAGDTAIFVSRGSGNWTMSDYTRASGMPLGMIGTCSQTSGVPTGAIIETGTNGNGTYTKWADGTMICTKTATGSTAVTSGSGSMYTSVLLGAQTYAATFASVSYSSVGIISTTTGTAYIGLPGASSLTASTSYYIISPTSVGSMSFTVEVIAIGRWF